MKPAIKHSPESVATMSGNNLDMDRLYMKYLLGQLVLVIGILGSGCSDFAEPEKSDSAIASDISKSHSPDNTPPPEFTKVSLAEKRTSKPAPRPTPSVSLQNLYPKKPSVWKSRVSLQAQNALEDKGSDVLVAPFQSLDEEFNASTRSLFTLSTADLIARGFGLDVSDVTTVNEALGISDFVFDLDKIKTLASSAQAHSIVVGTIQHKNTRQYSVELVLYTREDNKYLDSINGYIESGRVTRNGLLFDTKNLPIYTYTNLQVELLEELFKKDTVRTTNNASKTDPFKLSNKIDDFFEYDKSNPLESARRAQLLGLLHPTEISERYGRILYENSLVDLLQIESPSDEALLMQAEALLSLNRRPAALAVLQNATASPEQQALLEYANGNVADRASVDSIIDPLRRIAAHVRNQRLRNQYDLSPDQSIFDDIPLPDLWKGLFYSAYVDGHTWRSTDSEYLKWLLDEVQPDKAFSLDAILLRQSLTSWRSEGNTIEQATLSHLDAFQKSAASRHSTPNIQDFIDLVQSQLIENVRDKIYKEVATRGNIEYAGELVEKYEPLLEGQPDFLLVSSLAYGAWSNLAGLPPTRVTQLREKHTETGVQGFLHADRSQPRATATNNTLNKLYELPPHKSSIARGVARWPLSCTPDLRYAIYKSEGSLKECADNSIYDVEALHEHIEKQENFAKKQLLDANYGRFIGNDSRLNFLYKAYSNLDDTAGIQKVKQELLSSGNTDWALLKRIADTARLDSRFDEAADIIATYPEFKNNKNISNVKASNRSFVIGSRMYWAGAHEAAARLFELTVSRNTGSAAEMAANARLATIQGDYETAAYYHYNRIQRYRQGYAMRDLIGLISIMGDSEQALQFSNSLAPFLNQAQLWHGTLVAHRANGSTFDEIFEWAGEHGINFSDNLPPEEIQALIPVQSHKNRFLFMAGVVDRQLDEKAISKLNQYYDMRTQSAIIPKHPDGKAAIEWDIKYNNWWTGDYNAIQEYIVASRHLAAANALKLLYNSEFQQAERLLTDELLCHGRAVEFLWICAWAAGATNTHEPLTTKLENFIATETEKLTKSTSDPEGKLFDQHLALAMLLGFDNQPEQAIKKFKLSNADHLYTEDRSLFVRYQLLEGIRVLYEHSHDNQYKDLVLELAESYTVVDPFSAYNYSFIAMLSDDRDERVSALATLVNLDPNSRAISRADELELEQAKRIALAKKKYTAADSNDGI